MYSNLSKEELERIAQQARAKALADYAQNAELNKAHVANVANVQAQREAGLINDNLADALSYGAKTGLNQMTSGIKSGVMGLQHTGAEMFGMQDTANSLAQKLQQNAQQQAQRQAEINAQYKAPFGMLAQGVADVTSGAIGMLPTVGAFALTPQGKIAAAGKVAQVGAKALGFAPMGLQAGGGGINQALNEGADIGEAKQYGLGSAVKEVATELPFAGIAKVPGIANVGQKLAGGNKFVGGAINAGLEGAEEAMAEAVDPYIQRATYNPNAENASLGDMAYSALIGAATAGAINSSLAGAGKVANMAVNTKKQPKNQQKMANAVQKPQDASEREQDNVASNYITDVHKVSQNQSSKADFGPNGGKNIQNQTPVKNTPKISLEMSERNFDNVADKNVKAYQQENPEIKPFQQETAEKLLFDLQNGEKGRREVGIDAETRNVTTMHGIKRNQSEPINRMLNDGLSYAKIEDGLNRIIEDSGKENTPNAKRVELYVHDAMAKGYNSIVDGRVDTNRNYAISKMSLEELEAESDRLGAELATTTDEFKLEEISAQLDNIQKRMDLLRKDISPKLDRPTTSKMETVAENATTQENRAIQPEPMQYQDYDVAQMSEEVRDFYEMSNEAGKKYGFNIRVVTGIENGAEGRFDGQGNILLDGNQMIDEATISRVIGHEVYHYLKGTDEHKYIIDLAIKNSGKTKEQLVQEKINDYYVRSKGGVTLDVNAALDEIGAEFMQDILSDPQVAEQIWDTNPTLAERIMRFLQDVINQIRGRATSDVNRKALEAYQRGLRNMQYKQQNAGGTMYSLPNTDTAGRELSKEQAEYFKNSKVRDENGNLKVVYHGTSSHGFNVFDYGKSKFGLFGNGFYFTDNESVAESYTQKGNGDSKGVYKVYLNITNPINMDAPANTEWKSIYLDGDDITAYLEISDGKQPTNEDYFKALKNYCQDSGMYRYEAEEYIQDVILGMGFDGITHIGGGRYNKKDETRHRVYIAFEQEQIKDVTNKKPTADPDIRYSLPNTDTAGRTLSEQQQKYFANSKARDEKGSLIVMYHGSPNAGFTEFRSGTYFTPMKWYADGYKKQGASMLSYKKTANNPDTYEVYLNIEKPFDTRNPKERRIFEKEFYGQWGNGAPLADSGLPDWTDGMDLQEFIEEKGYDYDGLILDEGAVGGYGEEVKSRGLSYVVFSPEQVKNVDNQTPTNSADIRYALPKMPNQKYLAESDENLQAFMYGSKVVNEDGSPKVVYSGHGNTNLFGSAFDKKKATAGGFYFTANPDIASNYAKNKMGVKEYYEDGSEYRIKDEKGKYKLQLRDVRLTDEQAEKFDEWFEESLGWTFDRFVKERGGYDYRYRRLSRRNLADLYWLMSENGYTLPNTVYTSEGAISGKSDFEELMDAMGIEWDSYSTNHGGVFPVYLSIRNPIDTSKPFPKDVMKRLERIASRERRMSWDELDEAHWTADYPVYKWIEDIKEMEETGEETYWATQVPAKARKILQEMGYDGIKDTGGKMGGEEHEVWIAFEPTQVKSAIGNRGTFDPTKKDLRYSIGDLVDEYGAIPKGENPNGTNRDIDVPQQTSDFDKVSRWTRTAVESSNVDDTAVEMIGDELTDDMQTGRFIYEPSGNKEQVDRANSLINHTGWEEQLENFRRKYKSGQAMTADDIVLGERLIQEAQNAGEYGIAVDLIADIAAIGTELGKAVQALSVLKRLTPEGKVKALNRVVERINAGLLAQGKEPVALPEGIAEKMLQANSQQMQSEIWDEAMQELANQVPATLADKINAWRYLAMLSNPKTHIRNTTGGGVMMGVSAVKRGIQTQLENRLLTAGEERYAELNRNVPQEYFDFAEWSFENDGKHRVKAGGGRYNDAIGLIEQNKRIFKNDKLETARKANTELLEKEDMVFKKKTYIDTLARYMYSNGLSPDALQSTSSNASYEKGVEYATKEAFKATFQEASKVANLLSQMENSSPVAKVVMGALVPFKKTPINILKRGVEYSPIGLLNGLYKMSHDVETGKMTKAEAIDAISAGLTGTGIMVLGYFMASLGMITAGSGEDDERKQWYDQQMGSQNYALKLPGGGSATIDWLAPSVMPLMAGAELYKQLTSENPANANSSAVTSALESVAKVANPVLEMSMLQGVTGALQSYNSGTSGVLSDLIASTATSYGGQFIPAPVGALARTVDDTVRSSYAPKDSMLTKTGEKFVRQQMNKLPFASMANNPSLDVWGNEVERAGGNFVGRAFNNFLNPSTYSADKRSELDKELDRLYKATGQSGVIPSSGTSYIAESDSNPKIQLSHDEYFRYGNTKGQKSYQYVSAFVNSAAYSKLADADKAEIISDLYALANYIAKKEALNGRGYDCSNSTYDKVLKSGVEPQNYYIVKYELDVIADKVTTGQKSQQIAYLQGLQHSGVITDEQCWYLRRAIIGKFSKAEMAACPYAHIRNM